MFEVGFSELVMIGLVSLLVIGPERLPKVARIAGFWLGRTQKMVADFKAEIKQELQAEEIRQALQEQTGLKDYQQLLNEVTDTAYDIKSSLGQLPQESNDAVEQQVQQHEPK